MLRQVAKVILDQVRKTDIPVRFGGEEFLVFLPTNLGSARLLAERIRLGIESKEFFVEGQAIRVTISGGIADHDKDESLTDLIKKADRKLYQAKKGGRNKIVC